MTSVDAASDISVSSGTSIPEPIEVVTANSPRRPRVSTFDISHLAGKSIRKRDLHTFSVHFNVPTSNWVTRISYSVDDTKRKCLSFSFPTENDARLFGKAYSPPKKVTGSQTCGGCPIKFTSKVASSHCVNCGVQMCGNCSTRWGVGMIPKTYVFGKKYAPSSTVRVCKSCDWLSNAFCMALLQGQHNNAVLIHAAGNINLRCNFADIQKESMFPLHCAVMGGNLDLVKWLVDAHGCPLSVKRNPVSGALQSIQTSNSRTLMDLAMTGRPKIDILQYLVSKNLSISDTNDPLLAAKTLEALMSPGNQSFGALTSSGSGCDESVATVDDACIICYEKHRNCVLAPCGHQVCCTDCGNRLLECPVCKSSCSVMRIFKS